VELCCAMVVACLMKNYQTNKGTAMVLWCWIPVLWTTVLLIKIYMPVELLLLWINMSDICWSGLLWFIFFILLEYKCFLYRNTLWPTVLTSFRTPSIAETVLASWRTYGSLDMRVNRGYWRSRAIHLVLMVAVLQQSTQGRYFLHLWVK
jgi:hypothetical protein